jgi:hypothetical protein
MCVHVCVCGAPVLAFPLQQAAAAAAAVEEAAAAEEAARAVAAEEAHAALLRSGRTDEQIQQKTQAQEEFLVRRGAWVRARARA